MNGFIPQKTKIKKSLSESSINRDEDITEENIIQRQLIENNKINNQKNEIKNNPEMNKNESIEMMKIWKNSMDKFYPKIDLVVFFKNRVKNK